MTTTKKHPQFVSLLQTHLCEEVTKLFLGEGDLHGVALRNLEALQRFACGAGLHVVVKLHEGDVVPAGDQTHFFEAREPAEQTTDARCLKCR